MSLRTNPLSPLFFHSAQHAVQSFEGVRQVDKGNESRPTKEAVTKAKVFRKRATLEDIEVESEDQNKK